MAASRIRRTAAGTRASGSATPADAQIATTQRRVDAATRRRLAVEADVDPRSIDREIDDWGSVRGMAGHRAREVLRRHGLGPKAA